MNAMKKGGLYVLGHVTKGELLNNDEDPVAKVLYFFYLSRLNTELLN